MRQPRPQNKSMLDFCGRHNITSMIELVPTSYANKAMARLAKNDVKVRGSGNGGVRPSWADRRTY